VSTNSPNQPVKLTKTIVDRLTPPASGQCFVRDTELKGFALRITAAGSKSFIVEKRIKARVRRITLGRYGEITVEQARKLAQNLLGKIAFGTDPIAEKKRDVTLGTTLTQAFHEFRKTREKKLRPNTLDEYQRYMDTDFKDWQKKRITDITKNMVLTRHRLIGQRSESAANHAFRFLRALFNFIQATYDDGYGHSPLHENPVNVLTQTKSWYRSERRKTVIKAYQLKDWYQAVMTLKYHDDSKMSGTVADYLLFLLFTGLRLNEAATLQWRHVDFKDQTFHIIKTKNHEPLTLPMSTAVYELLRVRYETAINEYVFPGKDGKGYIVEPKRQIKKVIAQSQVEFTIHDLRRTFITIAESLDIGMLAIKRLVNHKTGNDVTAGYIISDVERLRAPMQKITDFILKATEAKHYADVIEFPLRAI